MVFQLCVAVVNLGPSSVRPYSAGASVVATFSVTHCEALFELGSSLAGSSGMADPGDSVGSDSPAGDLAAGDSVVSCPLTGFASSFGLVDSDCSMLELFSVSSATSEPTRDDLSPYVGSLPALVSGSAPCFGTE